MLEPDWAPDVPESEDVKLNVRESPPCSETADRGVPLRFLAQPPAEIPRYASWAYFQVDAADRRWAKIKEAGTFAFHLVDAESDVEARLFVVLSERGGR